MSRSAATIFRPLVDANISEASKKPARSHCVRNRNVILQNATAEKPSPAVVPQSHIAAAQSPETPCCFEPNRVRIASLAFAVRSSRVKVGNACQPGNNSSKMVRYPRLGFSASSRGRLAVLARQLGLCCAPFPRSPGSITTLSPLPLAPKSGQSNENEETLLQKSSCNLLT
jgi:hypothetical protein